MIKKPLIVILFCLYISSAALYFLIIPPWQGADEPTHFEQVVIFSERGFFDPAPKMRIDYALQSKIIQSMDEYNFWRYVGVPRPAELPTTFAQTPFLSLVASQRLKPELYYRVAGLLLKHVPGEILVQQLYCLRILSFLFSSICLVMVFKIGLIIFNNNSYRAAIILCFVLLLPQYNMLSVTVNNDTMFLAAYFSFLYSLLNSNESERKIWYICQVLLWGLLSMMIERVGLMVLPMALFHWWHKLPSVRIILLLKWCCFLIILGVIFSTVLTWISPHISYKITDLAAMNYIRLTIGTISSIEINYSFWHYLQVYMNSFFCALGWTRYGFNSTIFALIYALTGASVAGFLLSHFKIKKFGSGEKYILHRDGLRTLLFNLVFLFVVSVLTTWFKGFLAQGRFLFPVLWPLGYIFCFGFINLLAGLKVPFKYATVVLYFILFILNIHTIFFVLGPAFQVQ
ncbi:glycosyltransferase family 39 protein [candidate division CSSED10-310 bacterium]|uniref:Glycosyltransferase family 39 protein n=1 Tax=candidate division CSSED10-310 bacterium TaxID=2855610 RepID=A0ABV6Z3C7_UNCC1